MPPSSSGSGHLSFKEAAGIHIYQSYALSVKQQNMGFPGPRTKTKIRKLKFGA